MQTPVQDYRAKQVKRACTECRQQKAKCDAHLHPDQQCTRCRRFNLPCLISTAFRRQHKRERLSELEQEAETLRKRLRTSEPAQSRSPVHLPGLAPVSAISQAAAIPDYTVASDFVSQRNSLLLPASQPDNALATERADPTVAQSLNGVHLTPQEIDQLFLTFFQSYHPSLPILKPHTSPNAYYAQSEFLFWSIIGVSSRTVNPDIFAKISPSVVDLALLSANSAAKPFHRIQGLLLILTWQMARDPSKFDVLYPLAGLLIHSAKQIGLHMSKATHEFSFSKDRYLRLPETEYAARSDLWIRCVLVYQPICISKGQLPGVVTPVPFSETLGTELKLQLRCQNIVISCFTSVAEHGLRDLTDDRKRTMDILLQAFDFQLRDLESEECPNAQASTNFQSSMIPGRFHISGSRLCVQALHLFKEFEVTFNGPLDQLLATSCTVIDMTEQILKVPGSPPSISHYILYTLLLALACLLRLTKTPTTRFVDIERATSHLTRGIDLAKKMSIHNSDVCAKTARVMTQLSSSPKAFKKADGTADLSIRVFNRFAAGVVADIFWRWMDLFDKHQKMFPVSDSYTVSDVQSDIVPAVPAIETSMGPSQPTSTDGGQYQQDFFDEQLFGAFDWTLGDEFFSL